MSEARRMNITLAAMLARVGPAVAVAAAAGAYPTTLWAARMGVQSGAALTAELAAAGLVITVFVATCAVLLARFADKGSGKLALAFVMAGLARVLVCVAMAAVLWALLSLPTVMFMIWTVAFYFVALTAESLWLTKALKHQAPAGPPLEKGR